MSNKDDIPVENLNAQEQLSLFEYNPTHVYYENEISRQANRDLLAIKNETTDSLKCPSEKQHRSTVRARTLTEKGQAYEEQRQIERTREEERVVKTFIRAYAKWEVLATEIESLFASKISLSLGEREEKIGSLDSLCEDVHRTYEKLRQVRTPDQEFIRKVDTCDAQTKSLRRKLYLQSDFATEQSRDDEDNRSVRSTMSLRSRASTKSSRASSLISLKKADVAAELAAKEAEFNALQEQA